MKKVAVVVFAAAEVKNQRSYLLKEISTSMDPTLHFIMYWKQRVTERSTTMKKIFAFIFAVSLMLSSAVADVNVKPDSFYHHVGEWPRLLIEGVDYRFYTIDPNICEKMKYGDIVSNDDLEIQVINRDGDSRVSLVPKKTGDTMLLGKKWTILPQTEIPEDLYGTWKVELDSPKDYTDFFVTFHEDGTANIRQEIPHNDSNRQVRFAYCRGLILFSEEFDDYYGVGGLYYEDGTLQPVNTYRSQKGFKSVRKLKAGKVTRVKSVTIKYDGTSGRHEGIALFSADPNVPNDVRFYITCKKKPDIVTDSSLKIHVSDPDVLEIDEYDGWYIYARGKKEGTAQVWVETYDKKPKASNSLEITVLEGKFDIPDELLGVRWVQGNQSRVFAKDGRWIEYQDLLDKSGYFYKVGGRCLYRDGILQGDTVIFRYMFVDEEDGETVLFNCGTGQNAGSWHKEELQTGDVIGPDGQVYHFIQGIPVSEAQYDQAFLEDPWIICDRKKQN